MKKYIHIKIDEIYLKIINYIITPLSTHFLLQQWLN
jgi:hypothetical protein